MRGANPNPFFEEIAAIPRISPIYFPHVEKPEIAGPTEKIKSTCGARQEYRLSGLGARQVDGEIGHERATYSRPYDVTRLAKRRRKHGCFLVAMTDTWATM
jgi:hypothetical protein